MTQDELAAALQADLTPEQLAELVEEVLIADLLAVDVTQTAA